MKKHFLKEETQENRIRLVIFQLMQYFEDMYDILDDLLSFTINEEEALDFIEKKLMEMEALAHSLSHEVKTLEDSHTDAEQEIFEKTKTYEALRRTFNFLTALNVIDLDSKNWVSVTTKCVIDKIYYRQIKSLVYSGKTH